MPTLESFISVRDLIQQPGPAGFGGRNDLDSQRFIGKDVTIVMNTLGNPYNQQVEIVISFVRIALLFHGSFVLCSSKPHEIKASALLCI